MSAAAFAALGDPTRRQIVEHLSHHGTATATVLAAELDMSRQAAAKHLTLLADAGLAYSTKVGRETRYEPTAQGLQDVRAWIDSIEAAWGQRMAQLAKSLGATT